MKRIITLMVVLVMMLSIFAVNVCALPSPTAEEYHKVEVYTNGTGSASVDTNKVVAGETVTLTVIISSEDFSFWEIRGDFEIVEGNQYSTILTIKPLTDIVAIATFADGSSKYVIPTTNTNEVSPKTGDNFTRTYVLLTILVLAILGIMFSSYKVIKNSR